MNNISENLLIPFSEARNAEITESFRSLFYLILPSESKFQDVSKVPNYVNFATNSFIILVIIELCTAFVRGKKMLRINDSIGSMGAGVMSRLMRLASKRSLDVFFYIYVYENWRLADLPWDSTWTWLICFFTVDLLYYWFHRAAHEVNIMWAAHQTHHSSEEYNLTTALRQSIVQGFFSIVFNLPNALFIPPAIHLLHIQFNLLFQFWIHTELIDSVGPLEYILNTPSHHRVHHGRNPYCIDKNYAGTLIIWDRLFGTFAAERRESKISYGLVHNINTFNPIFIQVGYYNYLIRKMWNTEGFKHKLCVLFNGPGWSPGKPRLGDPKDIPEVEVPTQIYNPYIPWWLAIYGAIHYLSIIPFFGKTIMYQHSLSTTMLLSDVACFVITLLAIGKLLDKKPYAKLIEVARCSILLVLAFNFQEKMAADHHLPTELGLPYIFLFISSLLIWCWQTIFDPTCLKTKDD